MIAESEARDIRQIIDFFFGYSVASRITINDKVVSLVWDMLQEAQNCSKTMDLVPRPPKKVPDIHYIINELVKIALRVRNNDQIYLSCKNAVAYSYRSALEMASSGF